jgi:hypothetical protein
MTDEYILIDRSVRPGRNGVDMWRLTWQRISDNTIWETTVDSSYRNFRRQGWDHLVDHECPWGVYRNLTATARKTADGVGVITADSRPDLVVRLDDHAEAVDLAQASCDHGTHHGQYHDLFRTT